MLIEFKSEKIKNLSSEINIGTDKRYLSDMNKDIHTQYITQSCIKKPNVQIQINCSTLLSGKARVEQQLKNGYILFPSKGVNHHSAVVRNLEGEAIASHSFFVIKLKDNDTIIPEYVAWYLNQDKTQAILKQSEVGVTVPSIPRKALEEIDIFLPPLNVQQLIVETVNLMVQEQALTYKLLEQKELLISQRLSNLVGGRIYE